MLKGPGCKSLLAKKLTQHFPKGYIHYVEPFFRTGSVMFSLYHHNVSEVANDLDENFTNFWTVLQNNFEEFYRRVILIPPSQVEFDRAKIQGSPVDRAVAFFVKVRLSRTGSMKSFVTLTRNRVRRGMNAEAAAWWSAIDGLPDLHTRLARVVILNQDFESVLKSQDGPNTFFYVDPPYYGVYGLYEKEFSIDDHKRLLKSLANLQGKFMLSGYRNPLYNLPYRSIDIAVPNSMEQSDSKSTKVETIWMNY